MKSHYKIREKVIFNLDKKTLSIGMILGVAAYRGGGYIVNYSTTLEPPMRESITAEDDALSRYPELEAAFTASQPKTERERQLKQGAIEDGLGNQLLEMMDPLSNNVTGEDVLTVFRMMDAGAHGVVAEMLRNDCKADSNIVHIDAFHELDVDVDKTLAEAFANWGATITPQSEQSSKQ